jgi:hypothetical protein
VDQQGFDEIYPDQTSGGSCGDWYALLNPHGESVSHVLMELTGQLPL